MGGIAALILGTAGYLNLGEDFLDSLYNSFGLFVLAYAEPPPSGAQAPQGPDLALQIARFLAPLTTITAGLTALLIGLSQVSDRIIAGRLKNHTVICGPGPGVTELARNLRDSREPVVVAGVVDDGLLVDLRSAGVPAIEGDPASVDVLKASGIARASRVIAFSNETGTNFEIAAALASIPPRSGRQEVSLFCEDLETIDYLTSKTLPRTLSNLRRDDARSSARAHAEEAVRIIEWNSIDRIAALALISDFMPMSRLLAQSKPEILVVGRSTLADAFVLELAKQWWASRDSNAEKAGWAPLPVTLIDPESEAWQDSLATRFPGLSRAIFFRSALASIRELIPDQKTSGSSSQHVAFILDLDADRLIGYLAELESLAPVPVRAIVGTNARGLRVMDELGLRERGGEIGQGIEVFGFDLPSRLYSKPMLSNSLVEQLANLNHLVYLRDDRSVGRPADRRWEDLDERDRESNRRAAIHHLGYKLDAIGMTILPLGSFFSTEPAIEFSEDQVERLAIGEHDRWMEERFAEGWELNRDLESQDRQEKQHPDLVPWEELSEGTKNQDRIFVRALPRMLQACGFRIVARDLGR